MAELTPMMQQYYAVKERNPDDCLLFFRLGDFYEMFEEDARIASRELDLTLTSRDHARTRARRIRFPCAACRIIPRRAISRGWSQGLQGRHL